MILGKTVSFTAVRVEACRTGRNAGKPGPCPKGGPGLPGVSKVGKTIKKATAAPKVERRGANEKEQKINERHAEVEKIMKKREHHGLPTKNIVPMMEAIGRQKGWRKPNMGDMSMQYRGENGNGELRLHPDGWRATAPADPSRNLPAVDRVFLDINAARAMVIRNAGAPRPTKAAA